MLYNNTKYTIKGQCTCSYPARLPPSSLCKLYIYIKFRKDNTTANILHHPVHTGNNERNQNQWLKMTKRLVRQSEQPEQRRQMQKHIIHFCSGRAFSFCGPPPQQAAYWKMMLCNSGGFWFSGPR